MSGIEVLGEFGARRRQERLGTFSAVTRVHYTISRDDTASDHSRDERILGGWTENERTRRRRLPLSPSGHDGPATKHKREPVGGDAVLVAHLGAGSLPDVAQADTLLEPLDVVSSPRREIPYQSRAQMRTTASSSARQPHGSYRYEAYASRSEDEDGSRSSLAGEDDFHSDTASLPGNYFLSISPSGKLELGGGESATQTNVSSAEEPRVRQATGYEKRSRYRQDDIRERERARRGRAREAREDYMADIRSAEGAVKRATEEEDQRQELKPLQDDLPVRPVPLPPTAHKVKLTGAMVFAANYMDQSRKTGGVDPHPGLNRSQTHDVRSAPLMPTPSAAAPYLTPRPPIPAEKISSRRSTSSKTKTRKAPLLSNPGVEATRWRRSWNESLESIDS
ncbi:hypothetical protein CTA2_2541 [Colletotrichum tanaceti]|nr:hypothetical protein CTA2_2541 [Colletotrichum tanaceti]